MVAGCSVVWWQGLASPQPSASQSTGVCGGWGWVWCGDWEGGWAGARLVPSVPLSRISLESIWKLLLPLWPDSLSKPHPPTCQAGVDVGAAASLVGWPYHTFHPSRPPILHNPSPQAGVSVKAAAVPAPVLHPPRTTLPTPPPHRPTTRRLESMWELPLYLVFGAICGVVSASFSFSTRVATGKGPHRAAVCVGWGMGGWVGQMLATAASCPPSSSSSSSPCVGNGHVLTPLLPADH